MEGTNTCPCTCSCSLDIPAAPKLLGELCGLAVAEQVVELSQLPTMMEPVESADPKRKYVGAALKQIKVRLGWFET